MKSIIKYIGIFIMPLALMMASCEENEKYPDTTADETVIYKIKLINAGENGNEVLEGVINESTKEITFPRIAPETNLKQLKFEAEVSERASLDSLTYDFSVSEGESMKKKVISVVNGLRKREYFLTIRLRVPVFGAEFTKPIVYDHTDATSNLYPTFVDAYTRGSAIDGEYILIVTRTPVGSHLLKISELKNNQVNHINLNMTNVTGGTFAVHSGALVNGHVYIASLSGSVLSPLKIYHWKSDSPSSAPEVILDLDKGEIPGIGVRHGDNMSVNIDKDGNGFIFFGDNLATQVLRYNVTNYTTISNPTILGTISKATSYPSFNRVEGTSDYIFTGYEAPISIGTDGINISYTMDVNSVPVRGSDARVIFFNGERYLIMCTAARSGSDSTILYIYDISAGETTKEALTLFDNRADKSAIYSYSLKGPINTSPATQTGWYVEKDSDGNDDKLYIYAATCNAGFVLCEFPKKTLDD